MCISIINHGKQSDLNHKDKDHHQGYKILVQIHLSDDTCMSQNIESSMKCTLTFSIMVTKCDLVLHGERARSQCKFACN